MTEKGYWEDEYIVVNGRRIRGAKTKEDAEEESKSEKAYNESGSFGSYPGVEPEIRKNPAYSGE